MNPINNTNVGIHSTYPNLVTESHRKTSVAATTAGTIEQTLSNTSASTAVVTISSQAFTSPLDKVLNYIPRDLVVLILSYFEIGELANLENELDSKELNTKISNGQGPCHLLSRNFLKKLVSGYTAESTSQTMALIASNPQDSQFIPSPVLISHLQGRKELNLDEINFCLKRLPREFLFNNLETLTIEECECEGDVLVPIAEKCPNLKNLTITRESDECLDLTPSICAIIEKSPIQKLDLEEVLFNSEIIDALITHKRPLMEARFEVGYDEELSSEKLEAFFAANAATLRTFNAGCYICDIWYESFLKFVTGNTVIQEFSITFGTHDGPDEQISIVQLRKFVESCAHIPSVVIDLNNYEGLPESFVNLVRANFLNVELLFELVN